MSSKKATRDTNAPKRNQSAYLLYQNAMRDTFKLQNPGMVSCSFRFDLLGIVHDLALNVIICSFSLCTSKTFGQLAKYTSAMYAEMPPTEKEAWAERAESDKARYLHELTMYTPPPGRLFNLDQLFSYEYES